VGLPVSKADPAEFELAGDPSAGHVVAACKISKYRL